jgi:hypothetical protein
MSRIIDVIGEANARALIYCLLSAYLDRSIPRRARRRRFTSDRLLQALRKQ